MNEKTLLEAVVLAGELMLVSGAEIYRVEDTMNHMLKRSEYEQTETICKSLRQRAESIRQQKEVLQKQWLEYMETIG